MRAVGAPVAPVPAVDVDRRSIGGGTGSPLATMAKIHELLAAGRTMSFEFFPPKTPEMLDGLNRAIDELVPLGPSYVSVTYGALGATRPPTPATWWCG